MPVRMLLLLALGLAACRRQEAPAAVVGVWTLDIERSVRARLERHEALRQELLATTPPERRQEAKGHMIDGDVEGAARRHVEQMRFTLEVAADGTFKSDMTRPDIGRERLSGTWAQAGTRTTLTFAHGVGRAPMVLEPRDGGLAQVDEKGRPLAYLMRARTP
jgi:hypothetical protein